MNLNKIVRKLSCGRFSIGLALLLFTIPLTAGCSEVIDFENHGRIVSVETKGAPYRLSMDDKGEEVRGIHIKLDAARISAIAGLPLPERGWSKSQLNISIWNTSSRVYRPLTAEEHSAESASGYDVSFEGTVAGFNVYATKLAAVNGAVSYSLFPEDPDLKGKFILKCAGNFSNWPNTKDGGCHVDTVLIEFLNMEYFVPFEYLEHFKAYAGAVNQEMEKHIATASSLGGEK